MTRQEQDELIGTHAVTGNEILRRQYDETIKENAELQAGFDLRWDADMRAIKKWQEATGKTLVWPDHADLCVWLMTRLDALGGLETK